MTTTLKLTGGAAVALSVAMAHLWSRQTEVWKLPYRPWMRESVITCCIQVQTHAESDLAFLGEVETFMDPFRSPIREGYVGLPEWLLYDDCSSESLRQSLLSRINTFRNILLQLHWENDHSREFVETRTTRELQRSLISIHYAFCALTCERAYVDDEYFESVSHRMLSRTMDFTIPLVYLWDSSEAVLGTVSLTTTEDLRQAELPLA